MRRIIEPSGPNWTIFSAIMVECWITARFLIALLSETDIYERQGYGERRFLVRYRTRYIEGNGRLYRQRIGAAGTVVHHEEIGGAL